MTSRPERQTPSRHRSCAAHRQPIAFTLPPEIIAGIDAVAAEEDRSRAKMIEIILRRFLQIREGHRREAA